MSRKPSKPTTIKRAATNPFRNGSYSTVYDVLFHFRKQGISREALIRQVQAQLTLRKIRKAKLQNVLWDISVVLSSKPDHLSHPCIRKSSDLYEILGDNTNLKLREKPHATARTN